MSSLLVSPGAVDLAQRRRGLAANESNADLGEHYGFCVSGFFESDGLALEVFRVCSSEATDRLQMFGALLRRTFLKSDQETTGGCRVVPCL